MNAKIYNGNVQPNHKEYKIWVNDEGIIKTWNGTEWIEQSGGSGSGSSDDVKWEYYKIDWDKVDNFNLSDVKAAVTYSGITNCKPPQRAHKFISTCNMIDYESYLYSKIGGTNARIVEMSTRDTPPNFIADDGSWIANIKKVLAALYGVESIEWLIPITEEEFFTFGDDSEYKSLYTS